MTGQGQLERQCLGMHDKDCLFVSGNSCVGRVVHQIQFDQSGPGSYSTMRPLYIFTFDT